MKAYSLWCIAAISTIFVLNLAVTPGNAQALYGSIVGNVLDSTNASVPDAAVKITQKETNQTREGRTNAEGFYSFPTIPAGTYEVVVSKEGFQTVARNNVPLTINSVARVDLVLNVGVVAESVQVTAQAAVLQTDRAEVRSEVTSRTLENAPLPPGRNYENLFVTLPGFAPPSNFGPIPTNPSRTLAFSVNGASRSTVGLKIDGASSRSVWMRMNAAFSPSIDAIETVNVVTNSFDAEQGQAGGAAISVNIKSGTNALHGSAYEYHTNNNLKARPYFLPANQGKPKMIMNQFGGTIGGPIEKDKFFYFVSYERLMDRRLADNNAGLFTVPTAAIRKGDMSGSSNLIYDPATGNPDGSGRTPFAGNQVPVGRQDPIVTGKILPLLPLPTLDTLTNNYYASGIARFNRNQVDSKVNWTASDKLSVSGRFSITPWSVYSDAAFGDDKLGGSPLYNQAWTAGNSDGSVRTAPLPPCT